MSRFPNIRVPFLGVSALSMIVCVGNPYFAGTSAGWGEGRALSGFRSLGFRV